MFDSVCSKLLRHSLYRLDYQHVKSLSPGGLGFWDPIEDNWNDGLCVWDALLRKNTRYRRRHLLAYLIYEQLLAYRHETGRVKARAPSEAPAPVGREKANKSRTMFHFHGGLAPVSSVSLKRQVFRHADFVHKLHKTHLTRPGSWTSPHRSEG